MIFVQRIFLVTVFGLSNLFASTSTVIETTIDGTIHSGTVSVIQAGIDKAIENKAEAFLIHLDTPGGLLDSTRDIVKIFLNTDIPVIVYVGPSGAHAGSAGTFITMASHIAAMAPGTNIGAAHPVSVSGDDPEKSGGKHMAKKLENDTSAFIETIAKQRNRNAEWAKKAVIESDAIDEQKALKLGVIDIVAKDKQELLKAIDGKTVITKSGKRVLKTSNVTIVPLQIGFDLKAKNWLANPAVMFVLLLLVGLGFYLEMSHPGLMIPAIVGGIALILLLVANSVIPLSAIGIGLIILSFGLLISEIYVTSFGLLAAAGIVAFIIGAYLLFDPTKSDLRVPLGLIWGSALGIGTIATIIAVALGRTFGSKQTSGSEGMVGAMGMVQQIIRPESQGRIFVNGEYWNALSDEIIETGSLAEVVKITGLLLFVKKVNKNN